MQIQSQVVRLTYEDTLPKQKGKYQLLSSVADDVLAVMGHPADGAVAYLSLRDGRIVEGTLTYYAGGNHKLDFVPLPPTIARVSVPSARTSSRSPARA